MSSASAAAAAGSGGGYFAAQAAARGYGPSTSTALIAGDRRKIHTSFGARGEMVEEYDVASDALLLRKLRWKSSLGSWGPWEFEVGEPVSKFNANNDLMLESSNNVRQKSRQRGSHTDSRARACQGRRSWLHAIAPPELLQSAKRFSQVHQPDQRAPIQAAARSDLHSARRRACRPLTFECLFPRSSCGCAVSCSLCSCAWTPLPRLNSASATCHGLQRHTSCPSTTPRRRSCCARRTRSTTSGGAFQTSRRQHQKMPSWTPNTSRTSMRITHSLYRSVHCAHGCLYA